MAHTPDTNPDLSELVAKLCSSDTPPPEKAQLLQMYRDLTAPRPHEFPTMPKAVAKTMLKVIGEIGFVEKGGKNEHHDFMYQHWDDVVPAVRAACVKHGLMILQEMESIENIATVVGYTSSGAEKMQARVRVKLWFKFIDIDTGQYLYVPYTGEALNMDDKGVNKAVTSATKYVYIKVLQIAVKGAVDDNDGSNAATGTETQPKTAVEDKAPAKSEAKKPKPPAMTILGAPVARKPNKKQWDEDPTKKQWDTIHGMAVKHGIDKALVPWLAYSAAKLADVQLEITEFRPEVKKGAVMVALAVMLHDEGRVKLVGRAQDDCKELGDIFADE